MNKAVRTVLKYFCVGIALIVAIDFALYHLLRVSPIGPYASFGIMAAVSLIGLFVIGCLMHLRLAERRDEIGYRPDRGSVALLSKPEALKVSPIPLEQQLARRATPAVGPKEATAPVAEGPKQRSLPMPNPPGAFPQPALTSWNERTAAASTETPAPARPTETVDRAQPQQLAIPDLLKDIFERGKAIRELVEHSRGRLRTLEHRLSDFTQQAPPETFDAISSIQRILTAFDQRLLRVRELVDGHRLPDILKARTLLAEPLVLPKDAVNTLLTSKELPSLTPDRWADALEELFATAERNLSATHKRRA
ncbi:MAG: hypothetical protein KDD69_03985 [Bdellovibrionales bacterium]|nr:hypothetical protein [Bdellovibrionales bacterium]